MTTITKFKNGWYRVSGESHFSNVVKQQDGWHADLRYSESGNLRQFAGIWKTKRDAVEEATRLIERHD